MSIFCCFQKCVCVHVWERWHCEWGKPLQYSSDSIPSSVCLLQWWHFHFSKHILPRGKRSPDVLFALSKTFAFCGAYSNFVSTLWCCLLSSVSGVCVHVRWCPLSSFNSQRSHKKAKMAVDDSTRLKETHTQHRLIHLSNPMKAWRQEELRLPQANHVIDALFSIIVLSTICEVTSSSNTTAGHVKHLRLVVLVKRKEGRKEEKVKE